MTAAEFRAFIDRHGLTYKDLTREFGWAPATIAKYCDEATGELPKSVPLACAGWERTVRRK